MSDEPCDDLTSGEQTNTEPAPERHLVDAASRGDVDRVAMLLTSGSDPNEVADGAWCALQAAALAQHLLVVDLLIEAGADVNHCDAEHFTPLLSAATGGSRPVVERLLDAGADTCAVTRVNRYSALIRAAESGHAGVVDVLIDRGAPDKLELVRALMAASEWGYPDVLRLLLRGGADPRYVLDGQTALGLAREHGHAEAAALLEAAAPCE